MLNLAQTVCVVGPDVSVRTSLERDVCRAGVVPKTFVSADAFFARRPRYGASCLVLTVPAFNRDELDAVRRITSEHRETAVIVVTAETDIPMAVQAMKAGAVEFLVRPVESSVLRTAIDNALRRSQAILDREADLFALRLRYDSLSRREREVMMFVVAGRLNKQVGAALGISEVTVKGHRGRVMRKMAAESFAELVSMAMRLDLVRAPIVVRPTLTLWRQT